MTLIRKNPIGANHLSNFGQPKVNQRLEGAIQALNSSPNSTNPNGVAFDKPEDPINLIPDAEDAPEANTEAPAAEKRAAQRAEWKETEKIRQRAIQMEKEAKEKLAKAERFEQLAKTAQDNPVELAKALGMDPTEFLRKYQNSVFNIKEPTPELDPMESMKKQLEDYKADRERERKELEQIKEQTVRRNYILTKILPVITANPEKFELLNYNNPESSAEYMYDLMNDHFQETGEEWDATSVAEAYEAGLQAEVEAQVTKVKKLKKFSKHFREDTDAPVEEITLPEQLGENDSSIQKRQSSVTNQQLGGAPIATDTSVNTKLSQATSTRRPMMPAANPLYQQNQDAAVNSYQRQVSWDRKRENRLNRVEEVVKKNNIIKNY